MKKLAFATMLLAGGGSLVACTTTNEDPVLTADITLLNGGPGPIVCLNSPTAFPGRDGLRVNARLAGTGGAGFSDVYNCDVFALQTPPLTTGPGDYEIWVDYINDRGFPDDPTMWAVVDETDHVTTSVDVDLHVTAVLTLNNGFFEANWSLTDNVGNPVTQCPPGGGTSILGTIVGGSQAFDDIFNCTDGFNSPDPVITDASPIDDYTIVATLLDDQDNALGMSAPITPADGAVISTGNEYTDLGVIDIILD